MMPAIRYKQKKSFAQDFFSLAMADK